MALKVGKLILLIMLERVYRVLLQKTRFWEEEGRTPGPSWKGVQVLSTPKPASGTARGESRVCAQEMKFLGSR